MGCDEVRDSRAIAVADLNNDGKLDMIVANNADPPTIYLNKMKSAGNWFRVTLLDSTNTNIVGSHATLSIEEPGGKTRKLSRWVEVGSGYCSQSDTRLHFGIGDASITSLDVRWPDGTEESFDQSELQRLVNTDVLIEKGQSKIEETSLAFSIRQ